MSAKWTSLLRSVVRFGLADGATELIDPLLYPFGSGSLPLLCDSLVEESKPHEAYESGYRSLVFEQRGSWLKAKGVGIAHGGSRPIWRGGDIFTYFLNEVNIGGGRLIWGFSSIEEARIELEMTREARSLGCPAPTPVGLGIYREVHVIDFKDRSELFQALASTSREKLLERFVGARQVEAACVFLSQPTDVRVDEILYGFLHPGLSRLLDVREAQDFLRWVGSSCGRNLRAHHDVGLLHGTTPRGGGYMTNAHSANHLVDEDGTYTTDYHMAQMRGDKELRNMEVFFLASLMNPLPGASEAATFYFGHPKPLVYSLSPEGTTPFFDDRFFQPSDQFEEYAEAFVDGVAHGYRKRNTLHFEREKRREALLVAAASKKELFHLLDLPPSMQRGVEQVRKRLALLKLTAVDVKASMARVEADLE